MKYIKWETHEELYHQVQVGDVLLLNRICDHRRRKTYKTLLLVESRVFSPVTQFYVRYIAYDYPQGIRGGFIASIHDRATCRWVSAENLKRQRESLNLKSIAKVPLDELPLYAGYKEFIDADLYASLLARVEMEV